MVQIWLQIGVVGMIVGSMIFGFGASRHAADRSWQILYTLNFFICLIAAGLFFIPARRAKESSGSRSETELTIEIEIFN